MVTADSRGEWVLEPSAPLAPGDRALSLEVKNPQGGEKVHAETTVALSVPPPAASGATALAVALPATGAAKILQSPDIAPPNRAGLAIETVEYDAHGRGVVSGRAAPGATVRLYLGGELIATSKADGAGRWSASAASPIASGGELRLDQLPPTAASRHGWRYNWCRLR